eukprot:gnl/MRDRNA2_/MRDRNA2_35023_c0_seq1.p1 gnl/MRDRNA2_/MRDRNA2_35023_c0~~gnl/MRDRNA2_/MRDRNA2_35023_c0_seq1.p1  ORF type:complete len:887 (+),score=173.35 gnl/MRDRNA2_/MRDRNA2_35023_c0_seq1:347-2662(+)
MTPMLQSEAGLELYGFIGTWVNNNTYSSQAYINNVTGQCTRVSHSEGNGWSLSVDLGFTPPKPKDKIHPRRVVAVVSNAMFADSRFGRVAVHEAFHDGHKLTALDLKHDPDGRKFEDFKKDASTAQNATVFKCSNGAEGLLQNLQLAAAAQKFAFNSNSKAMLLEAFQSALALVDVEPISSIPTEPGQLVVKFKSREAQLTSGLPVYFGDAVTDKWIPSEHLWWNQSAPFKSVGSVVSVQNDTAVLSFSTPCVPRARNSWEPRLKVPKSLAAVESAKQFAQAAQNLAHRKRERLREAAYHKDTHLAEAINGEVVVGTLLLDDFAGHIDLQSLRDVNHPSEKFEPQLAKSSAKEGAIRHIGKVCVITEQAHGRMIDKFFDLPKIEKGERVVAHFTATGHGWASTEAQCGEFCKMKYNVSFDGNLPAEFMQWRDDCNENPTGDQQYGTWWEPRNGWCPGSVSSGVYFDITDSLKFDSRQQHRLTVDLSVLNANSGQYEPYTNLKGWLKHDPSMLNVDMKLLIYPKEAVKVAHSYGGKSCSKAHAALLAGTGTPVGDRWPYHERLERERIQHAEQEQASTDQRSLRTQDAASIEKKTSAAAAPSCGIDFEATAPWHLFHADTEEIEEMTWVSALKHRLIQGDSQLQLIHVNRSMLPDSWGQVGLRLRLERPGGGLDFDHWDRLASIGLIRDRPTPPIVQDESDTTSEDSIWSPRPLMKASVLILVALLLAMLYITINISRERWNASVSKRSLMKPIRKPPCHLDKDTTYGTVAY